MTGRVNLVLWVAQEVRDARQKAEADKRKLTKRGDKIEELSLKAQLLANDAERIAILQRQVSIHYIELTAMHVAASQSTKALEVRTQGYASLVLELNALHAVGHVEEVSCGT